LRCTHAHWIVNRPIASVRSTVPPNGIIAADVMQTLQRAHVCVFSPWQGLQMSTFDASPSHSRAGSSASAAGSSSTRMLHIEPEELVFANVQLKQTYKQSIRVANPLQVPVEFTIRSSHARYTVSPAAMTLKAGETGTVEVALKILHEIRPPTVAGVPQADHSIKDVFHLRSQFFAQRFHAVMYPATAAANQRPGSAAASPRSVSNSAQPSPSHSRSASSVSFSGIQTIFNHSRNPSSASALQSLQLQSIPSDSSSARHSRNTSSVSFNGLLNSQSKSGSLASLSAHHSRHPSGSNLSVTTSGGGGSSSKISAAMDLVRREKARDKEQQRKAEERAEALREQQRLQKEAAEQKERDRHTTEAELYRPFERASLKEARANIAVSSLFPPSSLSSTSKDSSASFSAVSTREFLALSQKARSLQNELDATTMERDQQRFNYEQLEKEYAFALRQVDQLHGASRAHRPVDIQAQLDDLLRAERAQLEVKNQRVLAVLRTKDAAIADREETIAMQDRMLQQQAFRLGELEAQLQERSRIAQQMEREKVKTDQ
jgi:hypothetical protein